MKRFVIFICLVIMSISAQSEEMPQWNESYEYLYGMNVTDASGDILPEAPLSAEYLRAGIIVEIINGMPSSDTCMLMFLLNGHLQPFYLDDQKYAYITSPIEGNGQISYYVRFDELFLTDCQINYLQIVTVGLVDVLPDDENDPIDHYMNSVTIPFFSDEFANTYVPVSTAEYALPTGIVNKRCDDYCQLDFYTEIGDEQITYPPFVQYLTADACSFHIIATGKYNMMQMLVVCDGIPQVNEDLSLDCFYLKYSYGYESCFTPENLSIGSHQVFAIAYPIYNMSWFSASTPKISFSITQ